MKYKKAIIKQLENIQWQEGDIGDIGNEIGIAIAEIIKNDGDNLDEKIQEFISGLRHGVSLVDGIH